MMKNRPSKKEVYEIVDILKKNLSYQTAKPNFLLQDDNTPKSVNVEILFSHYNRLIEIINSVKGWILPPDEKEKIIKQHNNKAREAYETGDLSKLNYGDLVQIHNELKDITELDSFRSAIKEELSKRYGNQS